MTTFRRAFRVLLACCAILTMAASLATVPALAQDGQVFKDWRVRCLEVETQAPGPNCVAEHLAVNAENRKPVLLIRAHYGTPDKTPVAVITVPLLVRLPPGLRIEVDNSPVVTLPFQICVPDGCVAQLLLKPDILAAFKKGIGGKVVVQVPPGREVATPFSLRGFTAGLAAVE